MIINVFISSPIINLLFQKNRFVQVNKRIMFKIGLFETIKQQYTDALILIIFILNNYNALSIFFRSCIYL